MKEKVYELTDCTEKDVRVIGSRGGDLVSHAEIGWMKFQNDFRDSSMVKSRLGWIVDDHEPLAGLCIISHVGLLFVFCYLLHICHKGNTNPYGKGRR